MKLAILHQDGGTWLRCYEDGRLAWEKRLTQGEVAALIRGLAASL